MPGPLLREKVLLVTTSVPSFWIPVQPEKVLLLTDTVPPLLTMPQTIVKTIIPFATVNSFRLNATPEFTVNTRTALLPLMVTVCPLPSMVVSVAIVIVADSDRAAATEGHRAAAGQCRQQVRFVADADNAARMRGCGRRTERQQDHEQNEEGLGVSGSHALVSFC